MPVNIVISNRIFLIKNAAAQRVLTGAMGPEFRMRRAASPSPSPLLVSAVFPIEIGNLRCRQGKAMVEVNVCTPDSPDFYSLYASFFSVNL